MDCDGFLSQAGDNAGAEGIFQAFRMTDYEDVLAIFGFVDYSQNKHRAYPSLGKFGNRPLGMTMTILPIN